ncbi:MAG: hypothetical protein ACXQS8_00530 [Candidatus Helarchaeales archaeon]
MDDLASKIYTSLFTATLAGLREEVGLARAVQIGEKIWRLFGEDIVELSPPSGDSVHDVAEAVAKFFTDVLKYENVEVKDEESKSVVTVRDCPLWKILKEKRLPPLCHKFANAAVENMVRKMNPSLIFSKGAEYRQGANRCEFEVKSF